MPAFSIVIVNYNYGRYLEQAIRSALDQSCQDFELIIVDGASTDNSVEIIRKYADRLAWWVTEPDKGQSDAFIKGFARAKGEFFLWLNADDLMFPGALDAASRYLRRHPDCLWLAGDTVFFDVDGTVQRCFYGPYWNTWLMKQTLVCGMVNGPSSIFHRSLYEKVGGIDRKLHYVMDMNLWMKFADLGVRFHKIHRYMWGRRIHEESKTSHPIVNFPNEKFKCERDKVILCNNRVRTQSELWWYRIWKIVTGTHFHTLYDTWRWRGSPIERMINMSIPKR
jgi:glycosyltransferase involved in cell wall biosynthesis